jgi:hypothetical protein
VNFLLTFLETQLWWARGKRSLANDLYCGTGNSDPLPPVEAGKCGPKVTESLQPDCRKSAVQTQDMEKKLRQRNKVRNSQSTVRNIYMSGFDSSTM